MNSQSVEYNGETYIRQGDGWLDSRRLKPPLTTSRELDRLYGAGSPQQIAFGTAKKSGVRKIGRLGKDFTGLKDSDFKDNVDGTTWRRRENLGGLLAERLSQKTGRGFSSHAVYRRPQVLLGEPPRFNAKDDKKINFKKAKFNFRLNESEARYSFYIEKPNYEINPEWEWGSFVRALRQPDLTLSIKKALERYDLQIIIELFPDGGEERRTLIEVHAADPLLRVESGVQRPITWETLADELSGFSVEDWCDLNIGRSMSRVDAISAGTNITPPIVDVFEAFLPLYDACGIKPTVETGQ
jgi:hypothetical protein